MPQATATATAAAATTSSTGITSTLLAFSPPQRLMPPWRTCGGANHNNKRLPKKNTAAIPHHHNRCCSPPPPPLSEATTTVRRMTRMARSSNHNHIHARNSREPLAMAALDTTSDSGTATTVPQPWTWPWWKRRRLDSSPLLPIDDDDDDDASPPLPPEVVPEEPNLYFIPRDLSPTYRPIPALWRLCIWMISGMVPFLIHHRSAATMLQLVQWLFWLPLQLGRSRSRSLTTQLPLSSAARRFFLWLVETAVVATLTSLLVQERCFPPSRISVAELQKRYFLPSRLSRCDSGGGVHFLQVDYDDDDDDMDTADTDTDTDTEVRPQPRVWFRFDGLYVNHGFGASSLSWLPALPRLTHTLQCRVGLGHDAPGFGFTQRPAHNNMVGGYTSVASATLGTQLLLQQTQTQQPKKTAHDATTTLLSSVLLMGHSMGAVTTLHMALQLPPECRKDIVLIAPALGVQPVPTTPYLRPPQPAALVSQPSKFSKKGEASFRRLRFLRWPRWMSGWKRSGVRVGVLYPVLRYILRRLVGTRGFWRLGLEFAWGNPQALSASDVLRFQWPSIVLGWEQGLIDFTTAAASSSSSSSSAQPPQQVVQQQQHLSDEELVKQVLQLPNTRISVIVGSKDRVVSPKHIRSFFQDHDVRIVEMNGLGHDPFEENVTGFIDQVKAMLTVGQ